jgi:hypothetical protein
VRKVCFQNFYFFYFWFIVVHKIKGNDLQFASLVLIIYFVFNRIKTVFLHFVTWLSLLTCNSSIIKIIRIMGCLPIRPLLLLQFEKPVFFYGF